MIENHCNHIKALMTPHLQNMLHKKFSIISFTWEKNQLTLYVKNDNNIFEIVEDLWSSWRKELNGIHICIKNKYGKRYMQAKFGNSQG